MSFYILNISELEIFPSEHSKNLQVFTENALFCNTRFDTFHATGLVLYPRKTSENQRFSDILRKYRKRPVAWYGLRKINAGIVKKI